MIDNFMKNMIWLVEEWMYNRPQGQIWMVAHEGPIDHYAHWDAHMIPTWDLWFNMQRTTVPLPAEPNAEERAIQDFYRWCLRPANVARVWEEPLRCVNSDELVTWYQNDFVLPALPPGVGPPSMLLLRALRHVTCMMLQPTFIHIRTKLRDLRGKFSFGRNNDWYTALYRFDEYTAACYLDLQVGVLNQFALQRERRQEWSFAEIDEEDALNYTGG
jgi:hypothetical protein